MNSAESQLAVEQACWHLVADEYSLPAGHHSLASIKKFAHQIFNLDSDTIIVGRDPSVCSVLLPGSRISRQHALLHVLKEGLMVRDLDSVNGTYVNGEKISEAVVGPGDVLSFDKITLKVLPPGQDPNELTKLYLKPANRPSQADHTGVAASPDKGRKNKVKLFSFFDGDLALVLTAAVCFLLGLSIAFIV